MWFAAHCFSSHRNSGWGITQKNWREKDFKKEVGRSLLLGEGSIRIAVGRSTRPLCRRGDERACKSADGESSNSKMFDCFQKQAWWELQKTKGRFDILREGLGTHWLPPWLLCEHQKWLCPPNDVWNYFSRGECLIALPNTYFEHQLLLQ